MVADPAMAGAAAGTHVRAGTVDRAAAPRTRVLQGMVAAVAEKGYAAVTVADVVGGAAVSKRTFYEHFAGKEECLLACYGEAADIVIARVRDEALRELPGPGRIDRCLVAYLAALDQMPRLSEALLLEVQVAGAAGRRLRRERNQAWVRLLRELSRPAELPAALALALVGGITELTVTHAEDAPGVPFGTLLPAALQFFHAVLSEPPAGRRP